MYDTGLAEHPHSGTAHMSTEWKAYDMHGILLSPAFTWTLGTQQDAWRADRDIVLSACPGSACLDENDQEALTWAMTYFAQLPADQQAVVQKTMQDYMLTDDYKRGQFGVPVSSTAQYIKEQAGKPLHDREIYVRPDDETIEIFDTQASAMLRLVTAGQLQMVASYGLGSRFQSTPAKPDMYNNPLYFFPVHTAAKAVGAHIIQKFKDGDLYLDFYDGDQRVRGYYTHDWGERTISMNNVSDGLNTFVHEGLHDDYKAENGFKPFENQAIDSYVNEYHSRYYQVYFYEDVADDDTALNEELLLRTNGLRRNKVYELTPVYELNPKARTTMDQIEEAIKAGHPYTPEQVRDLFLAAGYKQTDQSAGQ